MSEVQRNQSPSQAEILAKFRVFKPDQIPSREMPLIITAAELIAEGRDMREVRVGLLLDAKTTRETEIIEKIVPLVWGLPEEERELLTHLDIEFDPHTAPRASATSGEEIAAIADSDIGRAFTQVLGIRWNVDSSAESESDRLPPNVLQRLLSKVGGAFREWTQGL